jgi:5-methylcytosine-specific restriction enzyme A
MMQIRDLPAPVTASKADWQSATNWIGFTPNEDSLSARNQCQSTIQKQFAQGYVIEYITKTLSEPNPGFEHHPDYLREREQHKKTAGQLIAVHRLRTTARRLEEVLGAEQFARLQDMWAVADKRCRWSVAVPIVESYAITGRPPDES